MKFTMEWVQAALIRAVRTAAQVALGMFTVGMAAHEIDWLNILSVTLVAAVYSLLTSVATDLPELKDNTMVPDGSIVIDESNPDLYGVFLNFGNKTVEDVKGKSQVVLDVKTESAKTEDSVSADYQGLH